METISHPFASLFSSPTARAILSLIERNFSASVTAITPTHEIVLLPPVNPGLKSRWSGIPAMESNPERSQKSRAMENLSSTPVRSSVALRDGDVVLGSIRAETSAPLSKPEQDHLRSLLELLAHEFGLTPPKAQPLAPPLRSDVGMERASEAGVRSGGVRFPGMIGRSIKMQELFRLLTKICESDSTVLVQGENGSGKELIAKAIHQHSSRHDKPFVVQNCSAFNDNLLDSELFGHKRGSFTGAFQDKRGLFLVADKGTFFLDEVGDMSPRLQVKLLRVLEEGTFLPVGETSPVHVNVRIIAATNRDLQKMVEDGSFREDLYYRLHVLHAIAPPLRERIEDLPLLVEYFLQRNAEQHKKKKRLSASCLERLMAYHWPGNIRELSHEIDRLWVLSGDTATIKDDLLSPRIVEKKKVERQTLPEAVEALERKLLLDSLQRHRWNKTHVADELNISRRNLIRKCKEYQLAPTKKQ